MAFLLPRFFLSVCNAGSVPMLLTLSSFFPGPAWRLQRSGGLVSVPSLDAVRALKVQSQGHPCGPRFTQPVLPHTSPPLRPLVPLCLRPTPRLTPALEQPFVTDRERWATR